MQVMKKAIYFLIIIFVWLNSSAESKNIKLNFVVSGIGGANYFRWGSNPYTGWGESYGLEGEIQIIFKKENVGLGLSYGNIYETTVAKEPYGSAVWTRKVERENYLIKFLISPNTKIRP